MSVLRLLLLLTCLNGVLHGETFEVETRTGDRIPVTRTSAPGDRLLLWLPGEFGVSPRQQPTVEALAARAIEVWQPDLHAAWFLPPGRYSLLEVAPEAIADLLTAASATGKTVFVMAAGRSAALALTGVRAWQAGTGTDQGLGGAVLLHPNLYRRTPQGGESAEYLPIVYRTGVPVYLMQPEQSAAYWRVGQLVEILDAGGSPVFLQRLPGVADGFNTRPDFDPPEERLTARLPDLLENALRLLEDTAAALPPPSAPDAESLATPERELRSELLRPHADPRPAPPLRLPDLDGETRDLAELRGRVVLVNFWATWCPPCVEELPSLQRLADRLGPEGLEILTVDVGESAEDVRGFLADKGVRFPVLLDPEGEAFKRWQAYAFPTTLVLDRRHRIRYAVFGALAWDAAEIVASLRALLAEPGPET